MKTNNQVRAEFWVKAWVETSNSTSCTSSNTATVYADRMLEEFDKRFPEFKEDKE